MNYSDRASWAHANCPACLGTGRSQGRGETHWCDSCAGSALRRLDDADRERTELVSALDELKADLATLQTERSAFLRVFAESGLGSDERLRRLRLAIVPREVKRAECADCGERGDFSGCPHCGKVVCQLCAEREGEFCCTGVDPISTSVDAGCGNCGGSGWLYVGSEYGGAQHCERCAGTGNAAITPSSGH